MKKLKKQQKWRGERRKKNFSVNEITVVTESVRQNIEIIQSKLTNSITNKRKTKAWEEITRDVNTVGQEIHTIQEVKDKWKNLHSISKNEFSSFKRDSKKTGGGLPPSQSSEQIIEIFENTPAFSGLRGYETYNYEGAGKYYAHFLLLLLNKTGHVISLNRPFYSCLLSCLAFE